MNILNTQFGKKTPNNNNLLTFYIFSLKSRVEL